MPTIYAIHAPDPKRLAEVTAEMQTRGTPTIEVVDCGDYLMALEGSHRLAAAHALGLTPDLVVFEQDELIDIGGYDWFDRENWASDTYAAGEVAGELFSPTQAMPYSFT